MVAKSSLESIFAEEPVPLDVFVRDQRYLNNRPLSAIQYDAVRHAEQVFDPDTYRRMAIEWGDYWNPVRNVHFLTLQWGKGGGKDHVCRTISMRIAYLLACLRSPQDYYGLQPQDTIHLLNVASSAPQAQQAFFMPITRAVKKGWFANQCEPRENRITWPSNVEMISGHSDAESQEGLNLLLGIADEIDAFRSKEELARYHAKSAREPSKSAEGILKMMRTSSSTRFPTQYKNIRISYPRYKGSTIQRLTAQAQKDVDAKGEKSRHYVSGPFCTWDVNPRVTGPEVFAEDYEEDPAMARAMYECKPSYTTKPYFKDDALIDMAMLPCDVDPVTFDYRNDGYAWGIDFLISPEVKPIQGALYAMHADLAINGDRAGIAMAHVASWDEVDLIGVDEEGSPIPQTVMKPRVKVDFVASFEADASAVPPREIQIRWARALFGELQRRGFAIASFTFDQFQSADSMQILAASGIESKRVSTDLSEVPWTTLRDLLSEGRVTMPARAILRSELLALGRLPNGKVDHPPGGSKDEADALACAIVGAIELGGAEDPSGVEAVPVNATFEVFYPTDMPLGFTKSVLTPPDVSTDGKGQDRYGSLW